MRKIVEARRQQRNRMKENRRVKLYIWYGLRAEAGFISKMYM
jgi:hypothetical protein